MSSSSENASLERRVRRPRSSSLRTGSGLVSAGDRRGPHLGHLAGRSRRRWATSRFRVDLLDRLVVAADESAAYATSYTNFRRPQFGPPRRHAERCGRRSARRRPLLLLDPPTGESRSLGGGDARRRLSSLSSSSCLAATRLDLGAASPCAHSTGAGEWRRSTQTLLCNERQQEPGGTSRIVDLETGDTLLDLPDTVIYAAAFGPPGDDGLPRSAVVEDRDSGAVTLYDLATGDAIGHLRSGRR